MQYFLTCVTDKYTQFNGRASRKEYWMYTLVILILDFIIGFIFGFIKGALKLDLYSIHTTISIVLHLALFCPSLAVAIRRLHDTGRSGRFLLFAIIPSVITYFAIPRLLTVLSLAVPFSSSLTSAVHPAVTLFSIPFPTINPEMLPGIVVALLCCVLYLFYLTILDSTPGENRYGPNPKGL